MELAKEVAMDAQQGKRKQASRSQPAANVRALPSPYFPHAGKVYLLIIGELTKPIYQGRGGNHNCPNKVAGLLREIGKANIVAKIMAAEYNAHCHSVLAW